MLWLFSLYATIRKMCQVFYGQADIIGWNDCPKEDENKAEIR